MKLNHIFILAASAFAASLVGCAANETQADSRPTGVETSGFAAKLVDTKTPCFNEIIRVAFAKELLGLSGAQLIAPPLKVTVLSLDAHDELIPSANISILNTELKLITSYRVIIHDIKKCERLIAIQTEVTDVPPSPFAH